VESTEQVGTPPLTVLFPLGMAAVFSPLLLLLPGFLPAPIAEGVA